MILGGEEEKMEGGMERIRGQAARIRRQSEVISPGEDFKNKWADKPGGIGEGGYNRVYIGAWNYKEMERERETSFKYIIM